MQFIKNHKKYDTDKAVLLGVYHMSGESRHCLYKTSHNAYFLVTTIPRYLGGSLSHPTTYTKTEARNWAQQNLTVQQYEHAFGLVKEA